jgi:hypothetical protein
MADKLDGAAIVANSLPATAIVAGSITTTQLAPSVANVVTVGSNPKIASLDYPGDDTAANTGGGQTVVINGSGFKSNVSVYINGNAVPSVTYTNANSISITTPALAAATYPLYVINTDDGGTAILIPGIQYSGTPSWVTTSPLSEQQALSSWSISLSATSDSSVTYTLQAGSSLPTGISLAANGLISGTMSSLPENDTTYNFTVVATDAELQDASKAFSVSVTVVVDPQFQYTTLLLQADGTNNGNNHAFLDSSNNNFTITRNGNVTQGSFTPFSPTGWSNHFDGSGDYLQLSYNSNFTFGSGNFTIEMWVYSQRAAGTAYPLTGIWDDSSTTPQSWILYVLSTGNLRFLIDVAGSDTPVITSPYPLPINQWVHVAIVRNGNVWTMYVNGFAVTSTTQSYTISAGNAWLGIGSYQTNSGIQYSGYISNYRIVKGTAVYTSDFTPSTSPLTAISGTSVLTCQSNRFRDTSANAYGITAAGNVSVQTFSPFATTTAYSPATHGGSAYFDGSGDYLSLADNAAFDLGLSSSPFTIEFFFYPTTSSTDYQMLFARGGGFAGWNSTNGWQIAFFLYNNLLYFQYWNGSNVITINPSLAIAQITNQWNHIVASYDGANISLYANGTRLTTTTATFVKPSASTITHIGKSVVSAETYYSTGYITNYRIVKGTAIYNPTSSSLTVPTSPPSNVANTSLLCNFTNAQIYDAAAGIVLETVGDAKVNTAIKKFGAGSMVFDGNGDVLTAPPSVNYINGTSDWTYEFWVYYNALPTGGTYGASIYAQDDGAGVVSPFNIVQQGNTWKLWASSDGSTWGIFNEVTLATTSLATSTWHHIAFVRASGTLRMFVNGTQVASTALTASIHTNTSRKLWLFGTWQNNPSNAGGINGYIDDVRLTKGLARYRYNFTPPTRAFANKGGTQTLTADEYFDYTTLLLPGNGTNNQNNHTFLDSSTNAFTITRNGNATQGTFSPFSQTGWGNYFDGSGDYLETPSNAAFTLGSSGDFTVECWVYATATPGNYAAFMTTWSDANTNYTNRWFIGVHDSKIKWFNDAGASAIANASNIQLNTWLHVAVARSGSTITLYINGTAIGTQTTSQSYTTQGTVKLGYSGTGGNYFSGYISNARVVKGTAVYTANFTPPTAPLTAITNTQLLTCQSNRFVDNSSNAFAITRNGDVSVQAFSPFAPTASYAAANVGGSGYFDGSGDYLTVPAGSAFAPGTGDFTIEAWVYPTTSSIDQYIWTQTVSGTNYFLFAISSTATLIMTASGGGTPGISGPANSIRPYAWNHVAAVRSSGTVTVYVNGVAGTPGTNALDLTNTSYVPTIGTYTHSTSSSPLNGYLASLRYVKGTAVYATAFTPPTAPLTNIANTSFLCNFTNAGITDATAKNIIETKGDAKISTAQSKFGGSSIVFDGTGDSLLVSNTSLTAFGTGDFTVEAWVYVVSGTSFGVVVGGSPGTPTWYLEYSSNRGLYFYDNASALNGNAALVTGAWKHLAVARYNNTLRTFVDGVLTSSHTSNSTMPQIALGVGAYNDNSYNLNGYIQGLRITKGIARYTIDFTPPTTAFLTK